MAPLSLIGGGAAGLGVLLRGKLRGGAIRRNGVRVGSALPGEAVAPGAWQVRFLVICGKAAFQEHEPFEHGGLTFQMASAADVDTRSPVLRRFIEATYRVLGTDAPA